MVVVEKGPMRLSCLLRGDAVAKKLKRRSIKEMRPEWAGRRCILENEEGVLGDVGAIDCS